MKSLVALSLFLLSAAGVYAISADPRDAFVGKWEGESKCVDFVAAPNCHDEHVIYTVKKSAKGKLDLIVDADKVVEGKPQNMGTLDFFVNPKLKTITNEFAKGTWELVLTGDAMNGTLTLKPSGKIVRRVKVDRVKAE